MSRIDGRITEQIAKFLYEEVLTTSQKIAFRGFIDAAKTTVVSDYLIDDGIHSLTSTGGFATPDAANGRSQQFELTEDVTLNTPSTLADGESMIIIVKQDAVTKLSLTPAAGYQLMGSSVAGDIFDLPLGGFAWLSITKWGVDYQLSITPQA